MSSSTAPIRRAARSHARLGFGELLRGAISEYGPMLRMLIWSIVVPVSGPSIATVALVTIVAEWNDYIWPLIITTDPNLMTLPVGLTLLQNSESGPQGYGVMMAGAVIVLVPVLLVFAMLQRYIVAGLTQGSVAN